MRDLLELPGSAALLDAIMSSIPAGLTLAEADGVNILRVSDYGARLLGRPRADLEQITVDAHSDAYQVLDEDGKRPRGEDLPLSRAARGELVRDEEWLILNQRGEAIPILCNAGPVILDGQLLGGVLAWVDLRPQKQLEARLDALRAELQHRVKNHLQIIAASLRLEAKKPGMSALALAETVSAKIEVISHVYNLLGNSAPADAVSSRLLFETICQALSTDRVAVTPRELIDRPVSGTPASTLGMILNEMICNGLKHGFPEGEGGKIDVRAEEEGGALLVVVHSWGRSLPDERPREGATGLRLMTAQAKQLGGGFKLRNAEAGGVEALLRVPSASLDGGFELGRLKP